MPNKTKIRVSSLDYDGCLSRELLNKQMDIGASNKNLLDFIRAQIEQAKDKIVYLMVGSNRQSYRVDCINADRNKNGSCFPAFVELTKQLASLVAPVEVELDRFLLTDSYSMSLAGTSFDLAMDATIEKHADYFPDESKLILLFAQIHKIASKHTNAMIEFDFYDDREDILDKLQRTFNQHSELIPNNTTLNLYHYNGGQPELKTTIRGTGVSNPFYAAFICSLPRLLCQSDPFLSIYAEVSVQAQIGDEQIISSAQVEKEKSRLKNIGFIDIYSGIKIDMAPYIHDNSMIEKLKQSIDPKNILTALISNHDNEAMCLKKIRWLCQTLSSMRAINAIYTVLKDQKMLNPTIEKEIKQHARTIFQQEQDKYDNEADKKFFSDTWSKREIMQQPKTLLNFFTSSFQAGNNIVQPSKDKLTAEQSPVYHPWR